MPALKSAWQLVVAGEKPFSLVLVYDLSTLKPSRTGFIIQYGLDKEGLKSWFSY